MTKREFIDLRAAFLKIEKALLRAECLGLNLDDIIQNVEEVRNFIISSDPEAKHPDKS